MKLLAFDTSSVACTVGAMQGEVVVTRHEEQPRQHTKILMPMIRDVLAEAELSLSELDAIVLGNGPGSFIGLRIAASVAQGLAHGAGLSVAPVSSMAAVALAAADDGGVVAVAQDAHLDEVYLGIYRVSDDRTVTPVCDERLQRQDKIAELDGLEHVIAAGAGWHRYPGLADRNKERLSTINGVLYPSANALLDLGIAAVRDGRMLAPE
ncbi:MAG: tRNA (adenosine(37)-N6)-threonylcarbamoyltransferase complex dimerization subunit type 1 TsaB, partial [Woeseiaceae bacterium]|nr:tRNA (adenosine(37)-N6)-threonylcarbamoyltransferase complex dimerization subunit type 1 TsaB [Woeseiaceae bacterium]